MNPAVASCVQLSGVNVFSLTQLKKTSTAAFSMCISVSLARGFPFEKKTRSFHKLLFSFFVFLVVIVVVVVEAFFSHSLVPFFILFSSSIKPKARTSQCFFCTRRFCAIMYCSSASRVMGWTNLYPTHYIYYYYLLPS